MKISTWIVGESRADIVALAEQTARQLVGHDDLSKCRITYGDGEAENVDTRRGRPAAPPDPAAMKLMFRVQVTIEPRDRPEGLMTSARAAGATS